MRAVILDTETTGIEEQDEAVEIACCDLDGNYEHTLLSHTAPISFGAMGVHHITPDMTTGQPAMADWLTSDSELLGPEAVGNGGVVPVAHNAKFDSEFLPEVFREIPWICTYRCALALFPDAERHSNQSLRYELDLDVSDMPEEAGGLAHRALYDAWVTRALLLELMQTVSLRIKIEPGHNLAQDCLHELIRITSEPILLKTVRFGKHSGQEWSEVPTTYLHWITGQDFDEDVLHTANHYLRKRGARR